MFGWLLGNPANYCRSKCGNSSFAVDINLFGRLTGALFVVYNTDMVKGFWELLRKPIIGMSPMDGVTDAPWRFIAKKYGNPDVIYTEFVSAEGLWRVKKRNDIESKIWRDLKYDESERPIVAQLFGSDPASFYEAAKIICELGFDGVDINMGCPSPGLEKRGGGAGLMRKPELAREIIEETRRGVADWSKENNKEEIPVSVKTRVGSVKTDEKWWEFLSEMKLPAVAMHGRSFKQLYSGEADWDTLTEAAKIIRSKDTLFFANGDIKKVRVENNKLIVNLVNGLEIDTDNFDGVLIGRQAMGNPWAFRTDGYEPSIKEKLVVAIEHSIKYEEIFSGEKFFAMRKHLAWYAHGSSNVGELRRKLVMANASDEVKTAVDDYLLETGL